MGDLVGVFEEEELKGLSDGQREQLKQEVVRLLQTSPEIRAIINENPGLLAREPDINEILQKKARPFLDQLKK
jgi:hypothetical protein